MSPAHGLLSRSSQCDIYSQQVIELCPDLTLLPASLTDICLKEVPSIADSLYNIHLLKEFANEYLNKSFYLTMEDMLYSPLVLKVQRVISCVFINICNKKLLFKM